MKELQIIGRVEKIALPDLHLANIDAKVDTGAYTSSIHCKIVGESEVDGIKYVHFIPLTSKNRVRNAQPYCAPAIYKKPVKSSNGIEESRYFVKLRLKLGNRVVRTEFSLTDRSGMKHTVLLGRKFLRKRYLVDVTKRYATAQ